MLALTHTAKQQDGRERTSHTRTHALTRNWCSRRFCLSLNRFFCPCWVLISNFSFVGLIKNLCATWTCRFRVTVWVRPKEVFIMCACVCVCVSHWFRNLWAIWWIAWITLYAYFWVFIVLQLAVFYVEILWTT